MTEPAAVRFISGLPRSGSTLLSTLLRQNPRFVSSVTSPVLDLLTGLLRQMGAGSEFAGFFSDARRARILKGLMREYHAPGTAIRMTKRQGRCVDLNGDRYKSVYAPRPR